MKNHLRSTIIFFVVGLCTTFLTSACRPVKETTSISKYRQTLTTKEFCRIGWTKSIVRDTVDNYIVLTGKEKKKNAGSHSFVLKSKTIYYDSEGDRLKKYVSHQTRNHKRQRLRTIYYFKNHVGNTLYDLDLLDKTLNSDTDGK